MLIVLKNLNNKLKKLDPDIMEKDTDFNLFKTQITKSVNFEKIISGIGTYLRSDILYISKINSFRKLKNLKDNELLIIYKNSKILTLYDYDKN